MSWIQTASGRQFWPLDPRPSDVAIDDIAHALAHQCRFSGHVSSFLSVAQHSVLVSRICDPADALWGLLHDASEAYLVDLPSPLKRCAELAPYREAEERLQRVIVERYGLGWPEPTSVKRADLVMLATEARQFMTKPPAPWQAMPEPLSIELVPWPPHFAKQLFLERFAKLHEAH